MHDHRLAPGQHRLSPQCWCGPVVHHTPDGSTVVHHQSGGATAPAIQAERAACAFEELDALEHG